MKEKENKNLFDSEVLSTMGITSPPDSKVLTQLRLTSNDVKKIGEYKSSGYYKDAKMVRLSTDNINYLNGISYNLKSAGFGNFSVSILANYYLEKALSDFKKNKLTH